MKFLRTVSTRRLLAMIAGLVVAVAAGGAIAVAASGTAPVPPRSSLARAVRGALAAPAMNGITARISFTNHLIDASNLQGSDPILTGASGRLWLSADHRMRLELQSANGDAQIVVNNGSFSVYEPSANTVYEGKLPAGASKPEKTGGAQQQLPSISEIQTDINKVLQHANLLGPIPGDIAGHAAYTVSVSPKHDGGLLGSVALAWDAARGLPLRFAVYARGNSTPVLELKATNISYGAVPASDFVAPPPAGAKVVKVSMPGANSADRTSGSRASAKHGKQQAKVTGVAAVGKHLPFALVAPSKLVGLPRRSATLLDWGGHPAALLTYGQNLGGVAVIEQTAPVGKSAKPSTGSDHRGLSLPTVSINGVTGQELDTALGTVVRFIRGNVSYTVIGSVPATAADAAARAL